MKPWGCVTLHFVVFLSIVNLSKESCLDYYEMQEWGGNLSDTVSLVKMKDPKDTMECTLESECQQRRDIACHLLEHCFEKDPTEKSEKCKEAISQNSSTLAFYHFMCLSAKAFNYNLEACQYDTVCQLNTEMASTAVFDQTSLPPPVTTTLPDATTETTLLTPTTTATKVLPSTTTTTTTTTTKVMPSTTTATKVLPSTTTATKVLPSTTTTEVLPSTTTTEVLPSTTATKLLPTTTTAITALPPTATTLAPAVTQRVRGDNGGTGAKNTGTKDTSIHSILYPLSVITNVILVACCLILMALYRRLYHKCRQERTPWGLTIESNATLAGEEPMIELQSDTSSTNGDSESRHLMQPSGCRSVSIHADDVTSNWSAIEEGGQH